MIRECQLWGRLYGKQVILNEFVGQPHQPIERAIPIASQQRIGWVFWELMIGKTQFTQGNAPYQGHIYPDGTCRSAREVAAILHPAGYEGDPRQIAADVGFRGGASPRKASSSRERGSDLREMAQPADDSGMRATRMTRLPRPSPAAASR